MKKIDALTGARFFAIMLIVNTHFEFLMKLNGIGNVYGTYFKNATLGTNFFFMVSGFGMMLSYLNSGTESTKRLGGFRFALKHIKKIYPYYCFSMLLCIPHFFIESTLIYGKSLGRTTLFAALRLPLDAVLGQSLTGMTSLSHSFNGVCWFLSTLFCIYLVSPFLMSFLKKHISSIKGGVAAITIVVFVQVGLLVLFDYIEGKTFFDDLSYGSPYRRVFYVICGMILAMLYYYKNNKMKETRQDRSGKTMKRIAEILIIAFLVVYYFLHNTLLDWNIILVNVVDFLSCMVFIMLLVEEGSIMSHLFSKRTIVRLGDMSMYIFLFHYPLSLYLKLLMQLTGYYSVLFCLLSCVLIVVLSLIIAYLLKTKVEKRISARIDVLTSGRNRSQKIK